jgi:hypothetical protein
MTTLVSPEREQSTLIFEMAPVLLSFQPEPLTILPVILATLTFAYAAYGTVWRLYLSPITKIPGPRFAALTVWNEFYYDVYLGSRYT